MTTPVDPRPASGARTLDDEAGGSKKRGCTSMAAPSCPCRAASEQVNVAADEGTDQLQQQGQHIEVPKGAVKLAD